MREQLWRLRYLRWFGLIYAAGSLFITIGNLWPGLVGSDQKGDPRTLPIGILFAAIGLAMFFGGGALIRRTQRRQVVDVEGIPPLDAP